ARTHLQRLRAVQVALAAGALLLTATAATGHAATRDPVALNIIVDTLHLYASVAWLGGVAGFVFAVAPALKRTISDRRVAYLGGLVPRSAVLAIVSVQVLLLTGLYETWARVPTPSAFVATAYGRAL